MGPAEALDAKLSITFVLMTVALSLAASADMTVQQNVTINAANVNPYAGNLRHRLSQSGFRGRQL